MNFKTTSDQFFLKWKDDHISILAELFSSREFTDRLKINDYSMTSLP